MEVLVRLAQILVGLGCLGTFVGLSTLTFMTSYEDRGHRSTRGTLDHFTAGISAILAVFLGTGFGLWFDSGVLMLGLIVVAWPILYIINIWTMLWPQKEGFSSEKKEQLTATIAAFNIAFVIGANLGSDRLLDPFEIGWRLIFFTNGAIFAASYILGWDLSRRR